MKLALPVLLSATATIPSPSAPLPTLQLGSNSPDSRFRIELQLQAPLTPVNPTFINILHFMCNVALEEFQQRLQPSTYSDPQYGQVQIRTYAETEARFLIWGIYLATIDMVKFTRFHNALVKLYWENRLVGQIELAPETGATLSGAGNGTRRVIDDGNQPSPAGIGVPTAQNQSVRLNTTPVQHVPCSQTTDSVLPVDCVNPRTTASVAAPNSPTLLPAGSQTATRVSVEFERIPGATRLSRNDVFLAFFSAVLHLAKYPADMNMRTFSTRSPTSDVDAYMYETGIGCLNGLAITALAYVPQYMMEHSDFGYKETNFIIKLNGQRACRGSVIEEPDGYQVDESGA